MTIIKDSGFYKRILRIALPIALQNLITFATNMMDSVMISAADETGILFKAASLANQPFFILSMICFGLSGGAIVLSSQYWGRDDRESIKDIFAMILKVAAAVSFLWGALVVLIPEQIMQLYTADPATIAAAADYLRILGFAYLAFGISNTLLCMLRSIETVRIAVVVNSLSFVTNVFLNWVLIFGNLGAPAMGIQGAALATLIARLLEFVIAVVYLFVFDRKLKFRLRDLLRFNGTLAKDLLRHGTPVLFNELFWSLGITLQSAILGHIEYAAGDPVGAHNIANNVQQLSTIVIFGIGNAAAVMVGTAMGEGDRKLAKSQADTLTLMSLLVGVVAAGIILLLRNPVLAIYEAPAETEALAYELLTVIAFITFFVSLSAFSIVGVLRGGGDTRFCLIAEMVTLWGVATPLAFVAAMVLQLPVPLVLLGMKIDEPIKAVVCWIRLRGDKWMKALTRDRAELENT
ncbi:MAG: MATE family efflux transporter [Clostridia bacterium]|nr:MATE family efflux transporter [Clostridia bacterium]